MKKFTMGLLIVLAAMMLLSFGVFAEEAAVEIQLPIGAENAPEGVVRSASVGDITIVDVFSTDFYESGDDFNIEICTSTGIKDLKEKLTISVLDESGKTVATQVGSSFIYDYDTVDSIRCRMAVVSGVTLSAEESYTAKLSYTGSYTLVSDATYMELYPTAELNIKTVKVYDLPNAIFDIYLANVDSSKTYYATFNGSSEVLITPSADGFCRVDFDCDFIDTPSYTYYGCSFEVYSSDYSEAAYWYDSFNGVGEGSYADNEDSYTGVSVSDVVSYKTTNIWISVGDRTDYTTYQIGDSGTATLYNGKTGAVVASCELEAYLDEYYDDDEYIYLGGELTINTTLDVNTKYILAVYDGYDVRLKTITATDSPVCDFVGISYGTVDPYYTNVVPTGDTATGAIYGLENAPDLSKIDVKVYAGYGTTDVIYEKTGGLEAITDNGGYYKFTLVRKASAESVSVAEIVVYYDGLELYRDSLYSFGSGSSTGGGGYMYMWAMDGVITDEATYIVVQSSKEFFDPEEVDFTITTTVSDETETASLYYYRALKDSSGFYYYVLKADTPLTMSQGNTYLRAELDGEVLAEDSLYYISYEEEPFVYTNSICVIDGYVYVYGEGFKTNANYELYLWDANVEQEICVAVEKVSSGLFRIPINAASDYNCSDYVMYFVADGEPVCTIDTWYFNYGSAKASAKMYSVYSSLNHCIAAINMDANEYAYYRIAESESALASTSYKPIVAGITYVLPEEDGEITLYGQLKTSDGVETPALEIKILLDVTAPVINSLTNVPEKHPIKENSWGELQITFSFTVDVEEAGTICYYLADERGGKVTNTFSYSVRAGVNNISRMAYIYAYDNTLSATQLVVYLEDEAGNKSRLLSAPTSVVQQYSKYVVGGTTYYINNETGSLDLVDSEDEVVEVPSELGGNPVTTISSNAFSQEYTIKKIVLPESITTIESYAFANMALKEINIPSKVTVISSYLFGNVTSLRTIYLPAGLTNVDSNAFNSVPSGNLDVYFGGTSEQWDNVSIYSGGNSVLYDGNAKIHFADGDATIEEVYDEGHGNEGMLVAEISLIGGGNGTKKIMLNGAELYYSIEKGVYVGLVPEEMTTASTLEGIFILDEEPTEFIYGNVDGDYEVDDIADAVDSTDLQILKKYLKGLTTITGRELIASDVDGDGLCDSSDLQTLKKYLKSSGTLVFGVLK